MTDAILRCPACGSEDVAERNGKCVCWDCGHRFDAPVSESASDASKAEVSMKIFLSYGHTEEEIVSRIKERLEARGHEVWFDKSEIKSGDDWRESIAAGVSSSNGVIACLSKHAFRDGGVCYDEIDIAVGVRGGNIKTVLLDPEGEVRPPSVLMHIQWLDMALWREKLAAGPEVFEPWFERCMAELVRVVESKESVQFQGDITEIAQKLTVLVDNSRQSDLLSKPFQGREWLTEEVASWLDDRTSPRVCLITGDPGVGKSSFAAHLSHWDSRLTGRIAASVFCMRGHSAYNDARTVIQTLAYLLACRIPQYRVLLKAALAKGTDLGSIDEASLFSLLIGEPLSHAIDGGHECMAIVIDGIDEAGDVKENALAEVIGSYAGNLPAWMKVLVTSRRASAATEPFESGAYLIDIKGASEENMADVRAHLATQLSPRFGEESGFEDNIDSIAKGSGGAFLYAEYMADAVLKGRVAFADAVNELPQGLGGMFRQWFRWTFPDMDEYRGRYRDALGCILAAPGGALPIGELPVLFGWSANDVNDFMRRVEVFLLRTEDVLGSPSLAFNHAFVAQWLASEEAGAYRSAPEAALELMGSRWHAIAKEDSKKLTDYEAVSIFEALEDSGMVSEADELWGSFDVRSRLFDVIRRLDDECRYSSALSVVGRLIVLAEKRPSVQPAVRAKLLLSEGTLLDGVSRHSEAASILYQALTAFRELAEEDWASIHPDVAITLNNLGCTLSALGRYTEAEERHREALMIRRKLLERGGSEPLDDIALSLRNLALTQVALNKYSDAEDSYCESLSISRELAENDAKYLDGVATSLSGLGSLFSLQCRFDDAEESFGEALSIHRRLAEKDPSPTNLSKLASTLSYYGAALEVLRRYPESEACISEALSIYRSLAEDEPDAFSPSIARVLKSLALTLKHAGRLDEAVEAYGGSIALFRELAKREPSAYLPDVAIAIDGLAEVYGFLGLREDEAASYLEELSILQSLAEDEPDRFLPSLASCLFNLGFAYESLGSHGEAEDSYRKALQLGKALAEKDSTTHLPQLSTTLFNLGLILSNQGRYDEAQELLREALSIRRELAVSNPEFYLPYEATSLWNLACVLGKIGEEDESAGLFREAIDLFIDLTKDCGDVYWKNLIAVLKNYSYLLKDLGRLGESERAMHIWVTLEKWDDPDIHRVLVGIDDYLDGDGGGRGKE